jgi:hypothetical protein
MGPFSEVLQLLARESFQTKEEIDQEADLQHLRTVHQAGLQAHLPPRQLAAAALLQESRTSFVEGLHSRPGALVHGLGL